MIESLMPFGGIRIEDNIAIHNDKTVNMTREAFQQ
jgi:Xaa-Pro dipeptidase